MEPLSAISQENSTTKRSRINRSKPEIYRKIIAFEEILSLKNNHKSRREVANLLEVANSTMQSWRIPKSPQGLSPELIEFFSTLEGQEFLKRITMSAYQVIHFGSGGIRGLQEFLCLSKLDQFVASSFGTLQEFSVRCEEFIVKFGEREEAQLVEKMQRRKITAGLDEMFRGRHPCLVAIDVVSGFILLEKITEDRKAETWTKELKPRLENLNVELTQVVSDLCGGIRSSAKDLGAKHIPELFHSQYELSKATAAPLASQEREFENAVVEAEEKLKKVVSKEGSDSERAREALKVCNLRKLGLEKRRERSQKVREAKKKLGKIHHPINMSTGKLQTAEEMKVKFDEQLKIIENVTQEACLSQPCLKRIEKAKRAFGGIVEYLKYFFIVYAAFMMELRLSGKQEEYFNEVIFPLCYLRMIWKRLSKKDREEYTKLREDLEAKLNCPPCSEKLKNELMRTGRECAELFQRSSSCVEGRNGMLSLYYHRFHRLNERSIKALTTVHNFHTSRSDGTTAAERFFGSKHENLFESMLVNIRIPGSPKRQYHDPVRRQNGWKSGRCKCSPLPSS
jgi:Family of unknown function (DUF6399)